MPIAAKKAAATTKKPAAKKTATKTAAPRKPAAKTRESRTSKRKLVAIDRTVEALQLRRAHFSYADIGRALGISRQAAHQLVKKYYDESIEEAKEEAEALRQYEIECLDDLLREAWVHIRAKDAKSINTARQLVMDRAKLRGLVTDKQEVDANVAATGFFALPLVDVAPADWSHFAQLQTAGEEAEAEAQLLKKKPDEGDADAVAPT